MLQRSFRALAEASKDAFILVDAKGGWELANHHLPEWLGYTREEFKGIKPTDIFEPQDVQKLLDSFPRWLDGTEPIVQAPFTLRGKKGERIPVFISSHSWIDESEGPVAYLVLEDVRTRRNLEAQVAANRRFLDAVTRGGTIPVIFLRKDGAIMDVNNAACKWLGVKPEQLLTTRIQEYVGASSRADFDSLLSHALALQPSTDIYCWFRRSGGVEFGARLSLVGVTDSKGKVSRVLATMDHLEAESAPDEPPDDWNAYGQMMPGLLKELSGFISDNIREASEQVRSRDALWVAEPLLTRFCQSMDRVRASLASWADSAELLRKPTCDRALGDLIREAISARRAELERWGIEATLREDESASNLICSPALYPAILHILQSCVDELRESSNQGKLAVRVQGVGERVEATFLYEIAGIQPPAAGPDASSGPPEQLRSKNVELRAAQKLLESMGGTLVLQKVTDTQRSIRMSLNLGARATRTPSAQADQSGIGS